jgi:hypothetical protein
MVKRALNLTPASSMPNMITAVTQPLQAATPATTAATVAGVTAAAVAVAPVATLDIISQSLLMMSANPYIIGAFYLLMNLGGRYLSLELTKKQEAFLQLPVLRPVLLFAVLFIATRNFVAAVVGTFVVFFILWVAANEHSPYCMIPHWCGHDLEKDAVMYSENVKKLFG